MKALAQSLNWLYRVVHCFCGSFSFIIIVDKNKFSENSNRKMNLLKYKQDSKRETTLRRTTEKSDCKMGTGKAIHVTIFRKL